MIERRDYHWVNYMEPENRLLCDWVVRFLSVTIAWYAGPRYGVRLTQRRLALDVGRAALCFWALGPKVLS